jgi:drug/metabolite transporter (DMT)-like permease
MKLREPPSPILHQMYVSVICSAFTIALSFVVFGDRYDFLRKFKGSWKTGLVIAIVGAFSHCLLTAAQRYLTSLTASIAAVSSPAISTLVGAIFLDHAHVLNAVIGSCVCGGGLFLVAYKPVLGRINSKTAPERPD